MVGVSRRFSFSLVGKSGTCVGKRAVRGCVPSIDHCWFGGSMSLIPSSGDVSPAISVLKAGLEVLEAALSMLRPRRRPCYLPRILAGFAVQGSAPFCS